MPDEIGWPLCGEKLKHEFRSYTLVHTFSSEYTVYGHFYQLWPYLIQSHWFLFPSCCYSACQINTFHSLTHSFTHSFIHSFNTTAQWMPCDLSQRKVTGLQRRVNGNEKSGRINVILRRWDWRVIYLLVAYKVGHVRILTNHVTTDSRRRYNNTDWRTVDSR